MTISLLFSPNGFSCPFEKTQAIYRVGGGIAPAVLSHHRAYGSVHGGS